MEAEYGNQKIEGRALEGEDLIGQAPNGMEEPMDVDMMHNTYDQMKNYMGSRNIELQSRIGKMNEVNLASIETNSLGFKQRAESRLQGGTIINSANSQNQLNTSHANDVDSEIGYQQEQMQAEHNSNNTNDLFLQGQDPFQAKLYKEYRVAYLVQEGFLANFCCLSPFSCFKPCQDSSLEITLFQQTYSPDDQIQALVNLGPNLSNLSKLTMSLYIIIEIKDPLENNDTLKKYTVCDRIYEKVLDIKNDISADAGKSKISQRGIVMTIDLNEMNEFYKNKK